MNQLKLRQTAIVWFTAGIIYLAHAQKIEVTPAAVMIDEPVSVLVSGVAPGARVTIRAELTDGGGHPWAAEAEFVADAQGMVNTASQAPVKGSYRIVSAMGLLWSMRSTVRDVHRYEPPHALGPQISRFHLLLDGKEVSSAELVQSTVRPDVKQMDLNGDLHGVLFVPASAGKHPGILVVGGSEGGTPGSRAAWLASHGYVALALCYFHCPGTPPTLQNIPLEYFGLALGWMAQRPEVAADRLAVMGTSRGGELALQLGSMYPAIKAVVAYVPANVRYPSCCGQRLGAAWTWKGEPLAWSAPWLNAGPPAAVGASIEVEHTNGPILMIGGEADGVWPSAQMADAAADRLRRSHFAHPVVVLKYDHAGHRAGLPEFIPTWSNGVPHPISGQITEFGGTPEGNAESTLDAIPKVLDFLQKNLSPESAAN